MTVKELPQESLDYILMELSWTDSEDRVNAIDEDLYYILMDKTTGQALEKVHSVNAGEGLRAFQRLWVWFGCCSGMAIQERSRQVMNPQPPKQDSELSAVFENWVNQLNLVESQGQEYRLPAAYKITSLRLIMSNKQDKFDDFMQAVESVTNLEKKFEALVKKIREYANTKRLETQIA